MPIILMEHIAMYGIGKVNLAKTGVKAATKFAIQKQISILGAIKCGTILFEIINSCKFVMIPIANA